MAFLDQQELFTDEAWIEYLTTYRTKLENIIEGVERNLMFARVVQVATNQEEIEHARLLKACRDLIQRIDEKINIHKKGVCVVRKQKEETKE